MRPASEHHIPEGLLAANVLLSEKPRLGFERTETTVHQASIRLNYLNGNRVSSTVVFEGRPVSLMAQQQSSLGSSLKPPAPLFPNQTDAAMYAAAGISGAVQSTGVEWGAALYKTGDGMVGITPLRTDNLTDQVGVSDFYTGKDIPAGATRIGDVHGHTGINSPDKGVHMSPGDLGNAGTMLRVHGAQTTYMVNPAGQVWKFNPATNAKPVLLPGRIQ